MEVSGDSKRRCNKLDSDDHQVVICYREPLMIYYWLSGRSYWHPPKCCTPYQT